MPRVNKLLLTVLGVALAAVAAAGCGGGGDGDGPAPPNGDERPPAGADRRPVLDQEESFTDRFTEPGRWSPPAVVGDGTLSLRADDGQDATTTAPYEAPAGAAGVMVEALVRLDGPGRIGLFCLGPPGAATAYLLWYDPAGPVTIVRRDGATETVVGRAPVDPTSRSDPGEETLLRLLCAQTADGINLGHTVNASPIDTTITDDGGSLPSGPLRSGVAVRGGAGGSTARVSDFGVSLFRPAG